MEEELLYRHNVTLLDSMDAFANIKGGCNNGSRDVYFIRVIGESNDIMKSIENIDKTLEYEMDKNRLKYLRIGSLSRMKNLEDSGFYTKCYDNWISGQGLKLKNINTNHNIFFDKILYKAIKNTIEQFKNSKKTVSDTIVKNFAIKLFFWLDTSLENLFADWDEKIYIKIISDNVKSIQEYLFFQMLTFMGCDVMLVQNREDVDISGLSKNYSHEIKIGAFGDTKIKKYERITSRNNSIIAKESKETNFKKEESRTNIKVVIPDRPIRKAAQNFENSVVRNTDINRLPMNTQTGLAEKSFEELAKLASSVVLIEIHNQDGDIIGTGSGIMIGENGFILTNNHVAAGGGYYTVRIEEDANIYTTNQIVKYNFVTDLAVIRIDRQLNPIPIYAGKKKLQRGQRVVAIGSPLGFFNSVSDGIISGFRNINDVDMIQFTAPISHGSSGGAVLNMQGEVIGISTAGIDNGQNINLAVGYENILMFAKGFY